LSGCDGGGGGGYDDDDVPNKLPSPEVRPEKNPDCFTGRGGGILLIL